MLYFLNQDTDAIDGKKKKKKIVKKKKSTKEEKKEIKKPEITTWLRNMVSLAISVNR